MGLIALEIALYLAAALPYVDKFRFSSFHSAATLAAIALVVLLHLIAPSASAEPARAPPYNLLGTCAAAAAGARAKHASLTYKCCQCSGAVLRVGACVDRSAKCDVECGGDRGRDGACPSSDCLLLYCSSTRATSSRSSKLRRAASLDGRDGGGDANMALALYDKKKKKVAATATTQGQDASPRHHWQNAACAPGRDPQH